MLSRWDRERGRNVSGERLRLPSEGCGLPIGEGDLDRDRLVAPAIRLLPDNLRLSGYVCENDVKPWWFMADYDKSLITYTAAWNDGYGERHLSNRHGGDQQRERGRYLHRPFRRVA